MMRAAWTGEIREAAALRSAVALGLVAVRLIGCAPEPPPHTRFICTTVIACNGETRGVTRPLCTRDEGAEAYTQQCERTCAGLLEACETLDCECRCDYTGEECDLEENGPR